MSATWVVAVVQVLLFGDAHAPDCSKEADQVGCLINARFAKDPKAQTLAADLYRTSGDIAALGVRLPTDRTKRNARSRQR